jgi:hydroxymethylglutaryl-CoA lyase
VVVATNEVKIIECPRDAWQGLPVHMPAEVKADYLRVLVEAGFKHIDAVSFVSAAAVPQMSDSEKVLEYLDPAGDVEIIGIVVNAKGAERAIKTGAVQTLGFPYSISPGFLQRNQNQTPEESLEALEQVGTLAYKAGLDVVAYISMAFGNPYGDAWSIDEVVDACDLLIDSGVTQISLADTVGLATPKLVADVVADVMAVHDAVEIGVHLHARYDAVRELVRAAYGAGCRRFDTAIGGLGGCPFAQDALVGNLATEEVLTELKDLGAELPPMRPLDSLLTANAEISRKFGARVQ